MKRFLRLFHLLFSFALLAQAQTIRNYYAATDGLSGASLKTALYKIISPHTVISYNGLWTAYESTYVVPGTDDQVYDLFSPEVIYYSTASHGGAYNREHVVPQSWWGGGASYSVYSDLFNVLPSNPKANSSKSNYPLGEITGAVTYDNGRMRVGKAAQSGGAGSVFEPYDEFKGDFARIYMYVATCYQNISWVSKYYGMNGGVNTYPTLKDWIIPVLLKWNRQDPVSQDEIVRQEAIYQLQHNRNPYIDFPQLAEYVWGDSTELDFNPMTARLHATWDKDTTIYIPPVDTTIVPDDSIPPHPPVAGDYIYVVSFDEVETGNNYNSGGSSIAWQGNDSIASFSVAYCAGGAVRIGSSKNVGHLSTPELYFGGHRATVEIDVKGWTTVEGHLIITLGGEDKIATYQATMDDAFETVSVTFDHVPDYADVRIGTSTKRAYIDGFRIRVEQATGIPLVIVPDRAAYYYDLHGTPTFRPSHGVYIYKGKKVLVK